MADQLGDAVAGGGAGTGAAVNDGTGHHNHTHLVFVVGVRRVLAVGHRQVVREPDLVVFAVPRIAEALLHVVREGLIVVYRIDQAGFEVNPRQVAPRGLQGLGQVRRILVQARP